VRREDLGDIERLMVLFDQAKTLGFVDESYVAQLNFAAAAEHARVRGSRNAPGLFVWLVRRRKWEYITHDDEDTARRKLNEHLYGKPARELELPVFRRAPELSDDARLVQGVRGALLRRGILEDPFPHVQRMKSGWTRERWERAAAEVRKAQAKNTEEELDLAAC
jgi:hypothetical protein